MNVHGDTSPRPKMTRKERKSNCLPSSITKPVSTEAPRSGPSWGRIFQGAMVQATTERRPGSRKRSGHRRFWPVCAWAKHRQQIGSRSDGLSWLPGTWRELWPLACFAPCWSNECIEFFKRNLRLQSPT